MPNCSNHPFTLKAHVANTFNEIISTFHPLIHHHVKKADPRKHLAANITFFFLPYPQIIHFDLPLVFYSSDGEDVQGYICVIKHITSYTHLSLQASSCLQTWQVKVLAHEDGLSRWQAEKKQKGAALTVTKWLPQHDGPNWFLETFQGIHQGR